MSRKAQKMNRKTRQHEKSGSIENELGKSVARNKPKVSTWARVSVWCALMGWGLTILLLIVGGISEKMVSDDQRWFGDVLKYFALCIPILFVISFISGMLALIIITFKRFVTRGVGRALAGVMISLPALAIIVGLPLFHYVTNKPWETHNVFAEGDLVEVKDILAERPRLLDKRLVSGDTPMHIAARHGHSEVVEFLISKGAKVNIKNGWGQIPLHLAVYRGRKEVVGLLLANGADVRIEDDDGMTPVDIATEQGHGEIVELLREHRTKE